MNNLEEKLVVGTKIKIGEKFSKKNKYWDVGDIITLINAAYEVDNGLYTIIEYAPSIWNNKIEEYDSIYHLFENDLSGFLDCEIIK
jgi:hypothetical protein